MLPLPPSNDTDRLIKGFANLDTKKSRERDNKDDALVNTILPSYHMFQSTISKNLTPSEENFRVDPPNYEVTPTTSNDVTPSLSACQSPSTQSSSIHNGYPFPPQSPATTTANVSFAPTTTTINTNTNRNTNTTNTNTTNTNTDSSNDVPQLYPNRSTQSNISTFNEESADIWENTILANAHKLPNLSDSENELSKSLDININVTDKVCQKGVKPNLIDPLKLEYNQGDFIHGYVTIRNTSDKPISFDMVYVVFEGSLVVLDNNRGLIDSDKPITVYKFLNMLDLFASWSYANIDRLSTDNGDPHDWCDGETDPYDNTCLSIDVKRIFQPNITYKRFFSFRVPDKLLDDACETHNFTKHTEIPPSIGVSRNLQSIPLMYLSNTSKNLNKLKDFSFIDTYISYSVDARIIGKASEYNHKPVKPSRFRDQYVIANESTCPIRVIPQCYDDEYNINPRNEQVSLFYRAFVDSVKNKISYGLESLANSNQSMDSSQILSPWESPTSQFSNNNINSINSPTSLSPQNSSTAHLKQLYNVADTTTKENFKKKFKHLSNNNNSSGLNDEDYDDDVYQYLTPYKKKTLTGSTKILGVVSLSTPKLEYKCSYIPPLKFRNEPLQKNNSNNSISIPVEIAYFYEPKNSHSKSHQQPPEIKSISCELVALTVRSKKHEIPVEFNHEMCFKDKQINHYSSGSNNSSTSSFFSHSSNNSNKSHESDVNNFDNIVIKPFQNYYKQILDLMKNFGDDPTFRVENQFFKDLKALAFLQTKYINLPINEPKFYSQSSTNRGVYKNLNSIPWDNSNSSMNANYKIFTKKFDINVDLNDCHTKGSDPLKTSCFDNFTLVPDFQNCLMARLYYIKIDAKMANGSILTVNVPLSIKN